MPSEIDMFEYPNYRVTKDADLLGIGPADTERIKVIFNDLCRLKAYEEDGMEYKDEF